MKQDKAIDKIVYVATRSEEHSDYVEAVFFNKENAEKYCCEQRYKQRQSPSHKIVIKRKD